MRNEMEQHRGRMRLDALIKPRSVPEWDEALRYVEKGSGKTTFLKVWKLLHPSILAESSRSPGKERKNWR